MTLNKDQNLFLNVPRRSVMTHASVPAEEKKKLRLTDNLIRVSVGLEEEEDLIADLKQALS